MKEIFSYKKLFTILLAIFYIMGLVACFYDCKTLCIVLVFLVICLLILFLNFGYRKLLILFFVFILGILRAQNSMELPYILDEISSNDVELQGQIITSKTISTKNQKAKFYLRADSAIIDDKKYENLNTKILVSIDNFNDIQKDVIIGDYVFLKGKMRYPTKSSNPYQFDYEQYLLNNDVKNILYADNIEKIKSPDARNDSWYYLLAKFENIRNKIIQKHSKNIKSPKLEVLGGIVFGNETINPDENIKESFKNSGLLHLLAASGLNVALIYGIWWWIASLIRFPYNLSIFLGAFFVILYTFMTGFPPSILRASAMLLFVLFGKIIDRNANSLALIFFVGFLMLLFSPKMLFDVGFQLSFVVTIGLVTCVPTIIEKFEKIDKKYKEKYKNSSRFQKYLFSLFSPTSLAAIIAVPLVAQLFVIPLQMHYFNNLAPFSLLANIAVVPFIGILSFIGFVSSIFSLIPILNEPLIKVFDFIANPLLDLLIEISEIFSSFENSLIETSGFNLFQVFVFWILLFVLIINLKNNFKIKRQIICLASCFLILIFSFIKLDNFGNNLEVAMFDVGNADCLLLKTPNNKYFMIDTGKKSYRGLSDAQMIINKYLKNEKINKLEALIITHFDSDHCSGVIEILKNTKVKSVIIKDENAQSQIANEILSYLKVRKINYKIAKNDDEIYFEKDLKIKTYIPKNKNKNESSIVTLLNFKDKNLLFMGDVGVLGFREIEKYLNNVDVIKIGHHGAKNSIDEKMIEKLKPKYALISVGFNKFNHPHFSTTNLLSLKNIETISTKNYGFVKMKLDNHDFNFYYYDSDEKKIKKIELINKSDYLFHKTPFVQDFIKEYSN